MPKLIQFHKFMLVILLFNLKLNAFTEKIQVRNLENGLRVILIPDEKAPATLIGLYFRNGVRHAAPEPAAAAYIYQYLLFYGNEQVAPYEQVFFVNKIGGTISGRVNHDYSFFYSIVQPQEINGILWFEQQRLKNLLIRENEFLEQKKNVLERINKYLNQNITARGAIWIQENVLNQTPYQQPLYGTIEELSRLGADQIRRIYPRFFCRDNIFLIIAGNFNPSEIERTIRKDFLTIAFSNNVNNYQRTQFQSRENLLQKNWVNPGSKKHYTIYGFRVCGLFDRDYPLLEFIKYHLADWRSPRLEQLFAVNNLKSEAEVNLTDYFDSNLFSIKISAERQSDLEIARYILNKELENLANNLLTFKEVQTIKKNLLYEFWKNWQSLDKRSLFVAHFLNLENELKKLQQYPKTIDKITSYDILRITRKYFQKKNQAILNIYGL